MGRTDAPLSPALAGPVGALPDGVKDLFATIKSPNFQGIFDPANFVHEGIKPFDDGWQQGLAELTQFFHIKDKVHGEKACCPAGEGQGQFPEILADAVARGYDGTMTLEPHLAQAGQFKGFTGPELFGKAVAGLQKVCDAVGMSY